MIRSSLQTRPPRPEFTLAHRTRTLWAGARHLLVLVDDANTLGVLARHGHLFSHTRFAAWCAAQAVKSDVHVFRARDVDRDLQRVGDDAAAVSLFVHDFDASYLGSNLDTAIAIWAALELPRIAPSHLLLVTGDGGFLPVVRFAQAQETPAVVGCLGLSGTVSQRLLMALPRGVAFIGQDLLTRRAA